MNFALILFVLVVISGIAWVADRVYFWKLTEVAPGKYTGKADDVIGEANGSSAGNALNWAYTLALPVDGTVYHVQFDDWMYLVTPKVMINKAQMSKFGINLGEVTLSFYKR